MNVQELLIHFMQSLHDGYIAALDDLTDEQLNWRYNDEAVSPGFHAWHYIRTKDNIVNFVCQDRKPPVWLRKGLNESWNFPKVAQGTDMARDEAHELLIPSATQLIAYFNDVHDDVLGYLNASTDADLAETVRVVQFGHQAKSQQIMQTCIAHGNGHLGQILNTRTVMGHPARIDF